jgi:hypothetical protein
VQAAAPSPQNDPAVTEWKQSVEDWAQETVALLESYSPQAAASFRLGRRMSASYPGIADGAQTSYGWLLFALDNLRAIMEKPDVYY